MYLKSSFRYSTWYHLTSWPAPIHYWYLLHLDSRETYHKTRIIKNQKIRPCLVLLCPRIELRAMQKIAEGEELTVSYVDFLNLSADRQKKLKEHFYFECTCEHCSKHVKDDLMMAAADSKVSDGGGSTAQQSEGLSWVDIWWEPYKHIIFFISSFNYDNTVQSYRCVSLSAICWHGERSDCLQWRVSGEDWNLPGRAGLQQGTQHHLSL